ncbi:hypothetical protein BOO86_18870 [Mycobacterium sp. CBMA 234]|uniref:hypothetical protein n=1 Tax=Mycolicibacterium sp. CBMA 234 TaxID=1918495 RepID=UPI0012DC12C7|nr:hypothetical protein [Mycolicibacterium sp. CBMA 234]MUL66545.1 hypothetical protein [Mycolicibacterium sp. CBMA 234]
MTEPTPSLPARPQAVTVAFWCWMVAAVLLMVGGMLTAAAEVPPEYQTLVRGFGAITAVAGAAMAFSAGRARLGDNRFRRAATGLSMAIVVVIGLVALLGLGQPLSLVALLPLIAGTVSITRPPAQSWFDGKADT